MDIGRHIYLIPKIQATGVVWTQ